VTHTASCERLCFETAQLPTTPRQAEHLVFTERIKNSLPALSFRIVAALSRLYQRFLRLCSHCIATIRRRGILYAPLFFKSLHGSKFPSMSFNALYLSIRNLSLATMFSERALMLKISTRFKAIHLGFRDLSRPALLSKRALVLMPPQQN
jgi:hypothetical protein